MWLVAGLQLQNPDSRFGEVRAYTLMCTPRCICGLHFCLVASGRFVYRGMSTNGQISVLDTGGSHFGLRLLLFVYRNLLCVLDSLVCCCRLWDGIGETAWTDQTTNRSQAWLGLPHTKTVFFSGTRPQGLPPVGSDRVEWK